MNTYDVAITFDRETRDYAVAVDGNFLGYASTHHEGDVMVGDYINQQEILAEQSLPPRVEAFLDTLDMPVLPATFTATASDPVDAMLSALEQAADLINRLGGNVISHADEVTISVCGEPMTTVVVVVAPKKAVEVVR